MVEYAHVSSCLSRVKMSNTLSLRRSRTCLLRSDWESRRPLVIEDSDAGVASGLAAGFEVLRVSAVENVGREVRDRLGLG